MNDDRAMCCDACDSWVHVTCDPLLSDSLYDDMVQHPTQDQWYCSQCCLVHSEDNNNNLSQLSGAIKCAVINARSVVGKKFDLYAYLAAHQLDIIAITETFLDDTVHDSHIAPFGYVAYHCDRNRHGGGVMILIRNTFHVIQRNDLDLSCEVLWIELIVSHGDSVVLFGVFYRPPSSDISVLQQLCHSLHALTSANSNIILCGDFNVPNINWTNLSPTFSSPAAVLLCDLVVDNFLSQLVYTPTHGKNILDLVLTNCQHILSQIEVVDNLPGTDHDAVHFIISVDTVKSRSCQHYLYNYKRANFEYFESLLSRVPWNTIDFESDIETSWAMWKDLFFSVIDLTIPKTKWKQRKVKYWFGSDTISLIHQKRKLYRIMKHRCTDANVKKYKHISNLVRRKTRADAKQHVSLLSNLQSSNPKQFWRWINSIKGYRSPLPPLSSGQLITDNTAKAEVFNQYFNSVFTDESLSDLSSVKSSLNVQPSIITSVDFLPDDVYQELLQLNVSKACGPDLIPPLLLKRAAEHICVPLSKLFNQSMSSGELPQDWVTANVVPIHKRSDKRLPSNYPLV